VGLERRRNGNVYYYRSVRDGDKIRKVYLGAGETARVSHEKDVLRRTGRKAQREREKEHLERLKALAAPVLEASEAAEILARAHFIVAGYHKHKGEYRRARRA
jgi:hypothetical protein